MIKGITKNIAINPLIYKDLEPEESFVPYHIDIRNSTITDAGNQKKRPGYSEEWDLSSTEKIELLMPEGNGYAIDSGDTVYELGSSITTLTNDIFVGDYRLTYGRHNDLIIVCNGYDTRKIDGYTISDLGGSPPRGAKFIARISTYTILSGYDDTEFAHCAAGNPENWTTGDSATYNIQKTGEKIRNMKARKDILYFWKDKSIEPWIYIGGSTPFVRRSELKVNKGIGADDSVVEANDTFYWFGDDNAFYGLSGATAQTISKSYRREINKLTKVDDIYGLNFRDENVIRWFAPTNGKCFKYDYLKNNFSEDNRWSSKWELLPINTNMMLDGKTYIGDRNPTGKIYHWSNDYDDDDGQHIRVYRRFAIQPSESGNKVKFNRLRLRLKRGDGAHGSTPEIQLRFRIDKKDWSTARTYDLGEISDRNPWIDANRIGMGREIEIEVVETDAVNYLITHMDMTIQELGR